jgi:hypothetical protein
MYYRTKIIDPVDATIILTGLRAKKSGRNCISVVKREAALVRQPSIINEYSLRIYFTGLKIRSTTSAFLNIWPAIFLMSLTVNVFSTFS